MPRVFATPDARKARSADVANAIQGADFLLQAANDYDLAPSTALSAAMKAAGKTYDVRIYPAYGSSVQEGHSFGYFGSSVWGDDVFRFLERHCGRS